MRKMPQLNHCSRRSVRSKNSFDGIVEWRYKDVSVPVGPVVTPLHPFSRFLASNIVYYTPIIHDAESSPGRAKQTVADRDVKTQRGAEQRKPGLVSLRHDPFKLLVPLNCRGSVNFGE
jgi:hypothetical protein